MKNRKEKRNSIELSDLSVSSDTSSEKGETVNVSFVSEITCNKAFKQNKAIFFLFLGVLILSAVLIVGAAIFQKSLDTVEDEYSSYLLQLSECHNATNTTEEELISLNTRIIALTKSISEQEEEISKLQTKNSQLNFTLANWYQKNNRSQLIGTVNKYGWITTSVLGTIIIVDDIRLRLQQSQIEPRKYNNFS